MFSLLNERLNFSFRINILEAFLQCFLSYRLLFEVIFCDFGFSLVSNYAVFTIRTSILFFIMFVFVYRIVYSFSFFV